MINMFMLLYLYFISYQNVQKCTEIVHCCPTIVVCKVQINTVCIIVILFSVGKFSLWHG